MLVYAGLLFFGLCCHWLSPFLLALSSVLRSLLLPFAVLWLAPSAYVLPAAIRGSWPFTLLSFFLSLRYRVVSHHHRSHTLFPSSKVRDLANSVNRDFRVFVAAECNRYWQMVTCWVIYRGVCWKLLWITRKLWLEKVIREVSIFGNWPFVVFRSGRVSSRFGMKYYPCSNAGYI